ncbi:MAG: hypothetical protein ACFFD8_05435 [Candidatus Thorarchaeota archaeon]
MSTGSEGKTRLTWREAWAISGKIASEVQFRSALSMSQGAMNQGWERQIEKIRKNTRNNKLTVSIFICVLAAIFGYTIWGTLSGTFGTPFELRWITSALTISVFSLLGFAFLAFWGIMISTSFISTNAAAIGQYLPLSQSDAGKLSLLAYIRLFDVQMLTITFSFPIAYFIATLSITGALACLGAFLINVGLAITTMIILALYFYTRIQSAGGSRLGSIIRVFFIVLWAVTIMGVSLSYYVISLLIPLIESWAVLLAPFWGWLYFAYPFSLGTFVVIVTGVPSTPPFWLDIGVTFLYGLLAFLGIRWASRFLVRIGRGTILTPSSSTIRPVSVKLSGVGYALLRKDIRIATRTPGQAIMFFLPILAMVPVFLQFVFSSGWVYIMDVLIFVIIPTVMLGFFSIFFLSTEARGMAYTMTLPLKTERILRSKAQLLTIISVVIPLFVVVMSLFKPFTNAPVAYAIAISQIGVVYVSAFVSLVIFTRVIGGGRLIGFDISQHVSQMIIVGFLSAFLSAIPLGVFGLFWFVGSIFISTVQVVHWIGLAGLWIGIIMTYLLGKGLAKLFLID